MTITDGAIGAIVAAWVMTFVAPLAFPAVRLDATLSLVLMALAGAIVAFRQRQEDVHKDDGR